MLTLLVPGVGMGGGVAAAPLFSGPIPDIELTIGSDATQYDLSAYFTNATSYSIAPAVEAGWTFNAGVLTVDPTEIGSFGPYTVTGTNVGGSTDSNAFAVAVVVQARGGHYFPGMVGVRAGRVKRPEESLEEIVQEAVEEVLEESPAQKPRKPLRRVSKQRKRRIVEMAALEALEQRILLGELRAVERGVERLVNRRLEARRAALRQGTLQADFEARRAEYERQSALDLARREDEDLIAFITLLIAV